MFSFDIFIKRAKIMNNLLISGETSECSQWDIDSLLQRQLTVSQLRERLVEQEWETHIGPYCGGMTYLEIQQFDNTYNNYY